MLLTHTNSIYSEDLTLLEDIPYPQYVHQIGDGGGLVVKKGIKLVTGELVNYVLNGCYGATPGTDKFIKQLLQTIPTLKVGLIVSSGSASWTVYT